MDKNRMKVLWVVALALALLWVTPAGAAVAGIGFGGVGGGFGAMTQVKQLIAGNIATIASVAVLGLGMFFVFAKSSWMEMVGGLAFFAFVGIATTWASNNTGSFFGNGALLP